MTKGKSRYEKHTNTNTTPLNMKDSASSSVVGSMHRMKLVSPNTSSRTLTDVAPIRVRRGKMDQNKSVSSFETEIERWEMIGKAFLSIQGPKNETQTRTTYSVTDSVVDTCSYCSHEALEDGFDTEDDQEETAKSTTTSSNIGIVAEFEKVALTDNIAESKYINTKPLSSNLSTCRRSLGSEQVLPHEMIISPDIEETEEISGSDHYIFNSSDTTDKIDNFQLSSNHVKKEDYPDYKEMPFYESEKNRLETLGMAFLLNQSSPMEQNNAIIDTNLKLDANSYNTGDKEEIFNDKATKSLSNSVNSSHTKQLIYKNTIDAIDATQNISKSSTNFSSNPPNENCELEKDYSQNMNEHTFATETERLEMLGKAFLSHFNPVLNLEGMQTNKNNNDTSSIDNNSTKKRETSDSAVDVNDNARGKSSTQGDLSDTILNYSVSDKNTNGKDVVVPATRSNISDAETFEAYDTTQRMIDYTTFLSSLEFNDNQSVPVGSDETERNKSICSFVTETERWEMLGKAFLSKQKSEDDTKSITMNNNAEISSYCPHEASNDGYGLEQQKMDKANTKVSKSRGRNNTGIERIQSNVGQNFAKRREETTEIKEKHPKVDSIIVTIKKSKMKTGATFDALDTSSSLNETSTILEDKEESNTLSNEDSEILDKSLFVTESKRFELLGRAFLKHNQTEKEESNSIQSGSGDDDCSYLSTDQMDDIYSADEENIQNMVSNAFCLINPFKASNRKKTSEAAKSLTENIFCFHLGANEQNISKLRDKETEELPKEGMARNQMSTNLFPFSSDHKRSLYIKSEDIKVPNTIDASLASEHKRLEMLGKEFLSQQDNGKIQKDSSLKSNSYFSYQNIEDIYITEEERELGVRKATRILASINTSPSPCDLQVGITNRSTPRSDSLSNELVNEVTLEKSIHKTCSSLDSKLDTKSTNIKNTETDKDHANTIDDALTAETARLEMIGREFLFNDDSSEFTTNIIHLPLYSEETISNVESIDRATIESNRKDILSLAFLDNTERKCGSQYNTAQVSAESIEASQNVGDDSNSINYKGLESLRGAKSPSYETEIRSASLDTNQKVEILSNSSYEEFVDIYSSEGSQISNNNVVNALACALCWQDPANNRL